MTNIGIIGRARVGKDTAGAWLVANHGFKRVSFADPLRACALALDPIVEWDSPDPDEVADGVSPFVVVPVRLAELIDDEGWEVAKDSYPEVRRTLQRIGQGIRAIDEDFWLRTALKSVQEANEAGQPVVITDVRYRNEAASLVAAGFHLLHIARPGVPQLVHESEGALGPEDARYMVVNDGSKADLHTQLRRITDDIYAIESARQYGRSHA